MLSRRKIVAISVACITAFGGGSAYAFNSPTAGVEAPTGIHQTWGGWCSVRNGGYYASSNLTMRKDASKTSKKVATVKSGTDLDVNEGRTKNGYQYVKNCKTGATGWVLKAYVQWWDRG